MAKAASGSTIGVMSAIMGIENGVKDLGELIEMTVKTLSDSSIKKAKIQSRNPGVADSFERLALRTSRLIVIRLAQLTPAKCKLQPNIYPFGEKLDWLSIAC